jgi:hypothetical protein
MKRNASSVAARYFRFLRISYGSRNSRNGADACSRRRGQHRNDVACRSAVAGRKKASYRDFFAMAFRRVRVVSVGTTFGIIIVLFTKACRFFAQFP